MVDVLVTEIVLRSGYILYFVGAYLIWSKEIMEFLYNLRAKRELKESNKAVAVTEMNQRSLEYLLFVVTDGVISVFMYQVFSVILFLLTTFIVWSVTGTLVVPVISGICAVAIPYIFLLLRLRRMQSISTNEAESLVVAIVARYRACNYNMEEVIVRVIEEAAKDIPNSRKLLASMMFRIRETRDPDRILKYTNEFAQSLDASWARMLANVFYVAIVKGTDVSNTLDDILDGIRTARSLAELQKQDINEGVVMVRYLGPLSYVLMIIVTVGFLGISPRVLIERQFLTSEGLTFFIASVVIYLINLSIIELLYSRKFDY